MNCLITVAPRGRSARARELGMTLAEVVVALSIAGLTVVSLVGGYISSTVATEKASLSPAANTRALERLEDTHAAPWNIAASPVIDQLTSNNFPVTTVILDLSGQGSGTTWGTNYTTISQVTTTPPLRRVRVDCVWRFQNRRFSTVYTNTVETLRAPD